MKTSHALFVFYLAALSAFAPFSTDIYLASMPTIQALFNTTTANVQLTLSLFFVTFALVQLGWGPLSDRVGRRPVIFMAVSIFVLASLWCANSQTISSLISARILQAIGACCGMVLALSIVKDRFQQQDEMARALSRVMSVLVVAPMVAPIIGSYLLAHFGWTSNFYFLAIYGTLLIIGACFIPESHPKVARTPLPLRALLHAYRDQWACKPFFLATLAVSTNFSGLFAFISSSPFVYIKLYNLPARWFGYLFAFNAVALIIGNLSLPRLKTALKPAMVVAGAVAISLLVP